MNENSTLTQQDICINMILDAWNSKANKMDKMLSEISDEQLMKEVSPGRNRGIYLLGHLTVLANSMLPLLGYGENAVQHWAQLFIFTPDKQSEDLPAINELRQEWSKVKKILEDNFSKTPSEEWFHKHTSVSQEDFAKEPQRNKLNVVLSRVSHLDYHLGQLIFLTNKK